MTDLIKEKQPVLLAMAHNIEELSSSMQNQQHRLNMLEENMTHAVLTFNHTNFMTLQSLQAQLNQAIAEKQTIQAQLAAVYSSTSWKLTGPLRSTGDALRKTKNLFKSCVKFGIKVTIRMLSVIPGVKKLGGKVLNATPSLKARLARLVWGTVALPPLEVSAVPPHAVAPAWTPPPPLPIIRQSLSPQGQEIFKLLRDAIEE